MKYQDLISYEKKYGKCGNDLIVVIPCFINYDILVKHLGYLSKQTFQKFDVVIVLGNNFDDAKLFEFLEKNKFKFGIIVIKRKEDTGSAGGFFTGQKYGFENGYDYIINADDDCRPIDPNLIADLYSKREIGYVCCVQNMIVEKGYKLVMNPPCVAQYALFSRHIFEKYGFSYAPIYCGSEDSEFTERLANEKLLVIPNAVEHPYSFAGKSVLKNSSRQWLYLLSNMVMLKLDSTRLNLIVFFSVLASLSLFFIPMYGLNIFVTMTRLILSFKFGKEAYDMIEGSIKEKIFPKNKIPGNLDIINDRDINYLDGNLKTKMIDIIKKSLPFFRKDVVIFNTFSYFKIIVLGCLCRTLYFKMDEENFMLISHNKNFIFHIIRLLFLPIFTLFYCGLMLSAFILLKIVKQPRTFGYGLD